MVGFMDRARDWMTPERAAAFQGIGMGLSQLATGQPVNLSPAYEALQQRQQQARLRQVMEQPGVMDRFTPQQRAVLATMPENMAVEIIMQNAFAPPPDPVNLQTVSGPDGSVYTFNPRTGAMEPALQAAPQVPTTGYIASGERAAALGLDPAFSYNITSGPEGMRATQIGGGGTTVSVENNLGDAAPGLGKLSTDFGYVLDPATGQPVIDPNTGLPTAAPVPGSPAARDIAAAAAATERRSASRSTEADVIVAAAQRAREAAEGRILGGFGSNLIAQVNPASNSAEVERQVGALKANATFSALQQMRDNSPTGAALGAASDRDLQLLADKAGALDPRSPNFVRDLDDYERTLLRTLYGPEEGDRMFSQSRANNDDELFRRYGIER